MSNPRKWISDFKEFVKNTYPKFAHKKNIIVFESVPDFSDNTRVVFEEMIRRGLNEKYEMVWTCSPKSAEKSGI